MFNFSNRARSGEIYYGWHIAAVLAITETISYGVAFYAFGVFIKPMEAELGWTRGELSGAFSLLLLVGAVMAYPVGAWVDKHGARWLMTIGSILASLLVIAWSQVTNLTLFYLIFAGLGVCGALVWYEPAFAVIATWFVNRRGAALAVVTFTAGFASTIFLPLSDWLLNQFGWRDAVLILGILVAVTTIPLHALVLRRRPADLGLMPDGGKIDFAGRKSKSPALSVSDAVHSRFFWVLTLGFALSGLAISAIRVHFIPLLIDRGIDDTTAAAFAGAIGMMQVAGRVVFAPLEARFNSRTMVIGVCSFLVIAMFLLLLPSSGFIVVVFIGLFGMTIGAQTLARPAIVADVFGSTSYGRISSVMAIFLTLAATAAPFGAGVMYDRIGNYDLVIWIVFVFAIIATTVMLFSRPDEVRTPASEPALAQD